MPCSVLVVEDEHILAKNIRRYLVRSGYEVNINTDGCSIERVMKSFVPDVVLLDYELPNKNGLDILSEIKSIDPDCQVILITGKGSVEIAVSAMKGGACDFISKPLVLLEVKHILERINNERQLSSTLAYFQKKQAAQSGLSLLLGESEPIRGIKHRIRQYILAESKLSNGPGPAVLVTGETGTGKELVARAFHFDGCRADAPFVEINCASIPNELLESELFGYERGAFTDAKSRKQGLVESANGGTLFLDEIGDMSIDLQAKLLSLLENKRIRRVGGLRDQDVDVRIIAATNQNLPKKVSDGLFRADLLFRLNVIHIELPPLKERQDDILLLAKYFLVEHARRYGKPGMKFSPDVIDQVRLHPWPGNVRQLKNIIEHAVLLADTVVEVEHLALPYTQDSAADMNATSKIWGTSLNIEKIEQEVIAEALHRSRQNVSQAARLLGLSRDTLRYRLQKMAQPNSG